MQNRFNFNTHYCAPGSHDSRLQHINKFCLIREYMERARRMETIKTSKKNNFVMSYHSSKTNVFF